MSEQKNPFENGYSANNYTSRKSGYSKFIRDQIINLQVGEMAMVDIGDKDVMSEARRHVKKSVKCLDWKLQTKLDSDKNLWVKRVK